MKSEIQKNTGAPRLDRNLFMWTRVNSYTLNFVDKTAAEYETSRASVIEALIRSQEQGGTLAYHIAQIDNENKKYPKEIPAAEEPELDPIDALGNFDQRLEAQRENLLDCLPAADSYPSVLSDSATPDTAQEKELSSSDVGRISEVRSEEPNLWTLLCAALAQRVGEQNFEVWLESVRFISANEERLVLQVPNTYFQEYLGEHYTEVIQEELENATGQHLNIEFTIGETTQEPQRKQVKVKEETTSDIIRRALEKRKIDTLDKLEAFEDDLIAALHQRELDKAAERCTRYQGSALNGLRVVGFNDARMAEEVAILKARRIKEDARRVEFRKQRRAILSVGRAIQNLRQPGTPQSHRQYEAPSAFATEGGATRRDRANAERAFRKPAPS